MERRGRAAAPTAPMETAAAPPRSIGMFMPSTVPELRGRENLPTFLQRFRTWASISGCDSALDSEIIVRTSGTPRAELERVHDPRLVDISLNAWQSLTKALEKEQELLKMVIRIGSISEAWRALTKIANASEEVEYDRAKREFETLEMDASESVAEFFTRVHVILMELERHQIPIPDREIQRIVLGSLSPRFPHETSMHAYKGECDLKDLETGLARVEKFRSDQIKKGASPHALAAAYTGSGGAGAGGGTRGRGKRSGRRSGKRQDDGRDEQQQQQQQSPPWQQQRTPAWQQHQPPAWQQHQQQRSPAQQQQQRRYPQQQQQHRGPRQQQSNPWASWETRPLNSTGAECPIKGDNSIRDEDSRAGRVPRVSGAARMNISPLSAAQLHALQHRSIGSTAHPLQRGQRTTVMDIPRLHPAMDHPHHKRAMDHPHHKRAMDLHHRKPAMNLPRQCHDRLDLTDHLLRRPDLSPTGASHPANPRLCRHNMCHQASFRVRI